jgi:hypothetical protein
MPTSTEGRFSSEAVLDRILDAFTEGRAEEWTPPATGPTAERLGAEGQATLRLGRMTSADRSALLTLSAPREQALAFARLKQLENAERAMRLARLLLSLADLSKEGRAYADTMHRAAESYLLYQRHDYAAAFDRMVAALDATDRLAESWGNSPFIVCRRVDLAHNLMRVEMRRGAIGDAMERGTSLLRFVASAALDGRIASALFDLIIGTIAELVAPLPADQARTLLASLAWLQRLGTVPSRRAAEWLAIKTAALGDDPARFLEAALPFLRAGRGTTPVLWYAVALDLVRLHRTLVPDAAPDALDRIVVELASAPRVPPCMRPALHQVPA